MNGKLDKLYPHFLHASGRIWIARPGNKFVRESKTWEVKKVSLSPIPGATPVVELEEVELP